MTSPTLLKKELKRLKNEMKYKDGTEIVLLISIASDEMIKVVHMNPEVMYIDVTANTNRQKRVLFLMVVKSACGSSFIGNATFLPCGKKWVFMKIFQIAFLELYVLDTLQWNRLCLTDEGICEFGPLDNCIATMVAWSFTRHMLCVFYALLKRYKELVYPKLPHNKGRKKLTKTGENMVRTRLNVSYVFICKFHSFVKITHLAITKITHMCLYSISIIYFRQINLYLAS